MKHISRTSMKRKGLVDRRIVYKSTKHPYNRPRELTVDVSHGEARNADYAAVMVAVRTACLWRR